MRELVEYDCCFETPKNLLVEGYFGKHCIRKIFRMNGHEVEIFERLPNDLYRALVKSDLVHE